MNKMIVAVFDTEERAYEGLTVLKGLHLSGDIVLNSSTVLVKSADGTIQQKQAASDGPVGTATGLLAGSLIGLIGGPVGLAVGASLGTLAGALVDINRAGVDVEFVTDVASALVNGKTAVIADVIEEWTTPVDTQLAPLNAVVFRRLRDEVIEDQHLREAAIAKAEWAQAKQELAEARDADKAALQGRVDTAKRKLEAIGEQVRTRTHEITEQSEARIAELQDDIKDAGERRKAKREQRIDATRADLASRKAKLNQAADLVKDALR